MGDNADYKREKNFEKRREMECQGSADEMVEHLEREDGPSGSVSPSPSSIGSDEQPSSPQRTHRMASTFQLGDEQPALKPTTNLTKSFNNLFGPPTPAKVAPAGPMSGKMPTAAPSGLVGEVDKASLVKRSRKPLPVDPLTGQVIGDQTKRVEVREATTTITKRSPGGNHSQLW